MTRCVLTAMGPEPCLVALAAVRISPLKRIQSAWGAFRRAASSGILVPTSVSSSHNPRRAGSRDESAPLPLLLLERLLHRRPCDAPAPDPSRSIGIRAARGQSPRLTVATRIRKMTLNHPSPHRDYDLVLVGHHMVPADRPAIEVNRPNPKRDPRSSRGWNEQRHAAGERESQ